jgi:tetratricopeptide (TPR) repeat protein
MRVCICCLTLVIIAGQQSSICQQAPGEHPAPTAKPADPAASATEPMSDEDKANQLSEQVGKLMVKCVNLLTAQDPLSLDYCKQQRDLADQYPPHLRLVDKMMAHDEYGIALAAFDHKEEALAEFDREITLVPKAVKPGATEWSTAYWHRAMIYSQLGQTDKADHDYRAAEENFRKPAFDTGDASAEKKRRAILRQHAALLQKEGKTDAAHRLLEEAAK